MAQLRAQMNERKADSETNKLYERVRELELRCGDTITLPGCHYAIPIDVSELILVKNNSILQDGRYFSSAYQGLFTEAEKGEELYLNIEKYPFGNWSHGNHGPSMNFAGPNWQQLKQNERAYVFNNLININNLKYCKNLKKLTICGSSEVLNYNLSELSNLTHLTIIGSNHYVKPNPSGWQPPGSPLPQVTLDIKGNNPPLTDISWITSLTNLEVVSFRGCNKLSDVSALKGLTNLWDIDLRDTAVKDIEFLKNALRKIQV